MLLLVAGCLSAMRSTSSGRREARRACLAAARTAGWRVIDISDALFKGAARYGVTLVVERDSIPRRPLQCAFDSRLSTADLQPVGR
jgi:hypothetical protein